MQPAALLLILGVIILVGLYLYAPFHERQARRVTEEEHELSALLAERDRAINSLQELDFDFKLGKIPEGEYPDQRANLLQKGADILRKIDSYTPKADAAHDAESRLEKAAAARRAKASSKDSEITDEDIESMIIDRKKTRKDKSAGFCPKCGKPILTSDRFCPSCGNPVS
jgi:rubrerythrin